jgi:multicomponent Na+:H+ antiporter subunit A
MNGRTRPADALMPSQNRPLILETTIKVIYHSILVLAAYFLFAGHNHPGGGFVGGLMVGAAISLRYLAGGACRFNLPRITCSRMRRDVTSVIPRR